MLFPLKVRYGNASLQMNVTTQGEQFDCNKGKLSHYPSVLSRDFPEALDYQARRPAFIR
jgi:hypothetical protein